MQEDPKQVLRQHGKNTVLEEQALVLVPPLTRRITWAMTLTSPIVKRWDWRWGKRSLLCCDHLWALVSSALKWDHKTSSLAPREVATLSPVFMQNVSMLVNQGREKLGRNKTSATDLFSKFMFKNLSLKEKTHTMSSLHVHVVSNSTCESSSPILEVMG